MVGRGQEGEELLGRFRGRMDGIHGKHRRDGRERLSGSHDFLGNLI